MKMPVDWISSSCPEDLIDVRNSKLISEISQTRGHIISSKEFPDEHFGYSEKGSPSGQSRKESLSAQQIAELKRQSKRRTAVPTAIEKLNFQTVEYIENTPGIRFDTRSKKFYTEDMTFHKRTSNELNQAASALKLFEGISFNDILCLCNTLYENPYFAAYTDIGKRVYQIIHEWPASMTFDEPYYYRARLADQADDYSVFLKNDMMMPPEDIPSQGRYNEYGRSCFYFTDSPEGAVKEVAGHQKQYDKYVQVVRLKPCGKVRLIDLSKMVGTRNRFVTALRKAVSNENAKVKKEYLLPNYVAGCCREAGFDGIKYRGSDYKCYVLWNDMKMRIDGYFDPVRVKEYL